MTGPASAFVDGPRSTRFSPPGASSVSGRLGISIWRKRYASAKHFLGYCHEQAYLLAQGNPPRPTSNVLDDVLDLRYTGNVLHPTPISAITPIIKRSLRRVILCSIPFADQGSALLAAKALGRRYLGIEINPDHYQTATVRMAS